MQQDILRKSWCDSRVNYLSGAALTAGEELVNKMISTIPKDAKIISVGSGNGVLERYIQDKMERNIICIDPLFNGFNTVKKEDIMYTKQPDFATVDEYLNTREFTSTKTCLLLNWPYPTGYLNVAYGEEYAKEDYDIEAVEKLNSDYIVGLFGEYAGSNQFKKFMFNSENYRTMKRYIWRCNDSNDIFCSAHTYVIDIKFKTTLGISGPADERYINCTHNNRCTIKR